ncbi:MAG: transporter substrate-binding domain-containing protein, partial [Pseudomonadota bacterium]|nr:transporter substrate-binding domain-containing protein [Pseudomonadota bacterium]
VRNGADDLFFLTGSAVSEQGLAPYILPGPTVFIERLALMVPQASAARRPADLAGATVCLMIGSNAQRALEATAERQHMNIVRLGFEEDVEMLDAYNVQRCQAVVGEATALAAMRQTAGVNHLKSRILEPPLALAPVSAATGPGDGRWSAIVAWVMDTLILADRRSSAWRASGADAERLPAAELGLHADWQRQVIREIGGYGDLLRRNLGDGSGLRLQPGPNAPWPDGLLLPFGTDD